jgi:hypothetical protein
MGNPPYLQSDKALARRFDPRSDRFSPRVSGLFSGSWTGGLQDWLGGYLAGLFSGSSRFLKFGSFPATAQGENPIFRFSSEVFVRQGNGSGTGHAEG